MLPTLFHGSVVQTGLEHLVQMAAVSVQKGSEHLLVLHVRNVALLTQNSEFIIAAAANLLAGAYEAHKHAYFVFANELSHVLQASTIHRNADKRDAGSLLLGKSL